FCAQCDRRPRLRRQPDISGGFSVQSRSGVTSLPRFAGCVHPSPRIGERKHESQQHLPQQRGRLLADGAGGSGRERQALLAHTRAILAAPRRACGARRRRSGHAPAPRRLGHALIIFRCTAARRGRQLASAFPRLCPVAVAAAGHCGERARARQSTLAPDALTTSAHFGISDFTYARSSSGVPPTTSMPRSVKALRTGGSLTVAAVARCSVAMTSFGVPAGATSACQVVASKPGKPDSAMVGTSGNTAVRLSVVIASARIVPLWM